MNPIKFQEVVLRWFDQNGRKDLPWQQNKTAYRVWVSEIMLQQTQVATVIPYYQRFMQQFPDLTTLAAATEDAVLHLWTGLGYYSRARNLHRTAKLIKEDFQEVFPNTLEELQTLPGIGRSTAGAILALAFQKHATILDGNVKRVLTRFLGISEWPGEKNVLATLWNAAESFTPKIRIADYTQAMMDLGATLCVRGTPACEGCPLQTNCQAFALGIQKTIPRSKPKKNLPIRKTFLLVLKKQHFILLEKRPAAGIWGGLWSLPELPFGTSPSDIKKFCRTQFQLLSDAMQFGESFRHTFSHFHLEITPVFIEARKKIQKVMEDEKQIWYNLQNSQPLGLPAPIKKILHTL